MKKAELQTLLDQRLHDNNSLQVELIECKNKLSEKTNLISHLERKNNETLDRLEGLVYSINAKCDNCGFMGKIDVAKGREVRTARCPYCFCHIMRLVGLQPNGSTFKAS